MISLLFLNNFYPVISFGHSLWSANQLPAQLPDNETEMPIKPKVPQEFLKVRKRERLSPEVKKKSKVLMKKNFNSTTNSWWKFAGRNWVTRIASKWKKKKKEIERLSPFKIEVKKKGGKIKGTRLDHVSGDEGWNNATRRELGRNPMIVRRKCRRFGCAFIDQISLERTPKHRRPKRSYNVPPPPPPTSFSTSSSSACSTFSRPAMLVFLSPSVFQTVHKTVIRNRFCLRSRSRYYRETDKRRVSKIVPPPYCLRPRNCTSLPIFGWKSSGRSQRKIMISSTWNDRPIERIWGKGGMIAISK